MIYEGFNNHPLKKFGDTDQEVVVILVEACGTKQNVHGTEVFVLKRYITWKQHWALIIIVDNIFMARDMAYEFHLLEWVIVGMMLRLWDI